MKLLVVCDWKEEFLMDLTHQQPLTVQIVANRSVAEEKLQCVCTVDGGDYIREQVGHDL